MQKIKESIARLKKNKNIKPTDILKASPFDRDKDLNKLLNEDVFFDRLFYENTIFKNAKQNLFEDITSKDWTNRIIFFNGFSGIGKTTFLRSFIHDYNDTMDHYYFDVHKHVKKIEGNHLNNEHALSGSFSNYFYELKKEQPKQLEYYFYFIKSHSSLLRNISNELKNKVESLPERYNPKSLLDFLFSLNLEYIFYLFFIYIFKYEENNRFRIFYFDNLDAIEIAYISSQFKRNFPVYLQTINDISREEGFGFSQSLDFINNYKFVFCLRDANYSQVQAPSEHQTDNIWASILSKDLKLSFDNDLYKNIIQKRIMFIREIIPASRIKGTIYENKEVANFFNDIIINDEIFENITLPLYNYDNRKLVINLYQIAEDKDVLDIDFKSFYNKNKHGARGSILYGLLKFNFSNNFLKKFLDNKIPSKLPKGYCDPRRMILTTLSNVGNYTTYNHTTDIQVEKEVDFLDFILRIKKLYSITTIINVLVELYLDYQYSWTHLITIKNKAIKSKNSFDFEKNLLEELENINSNYTGNREQTDRMRQIKEDLNTIKIKINPSAFSFLRHIIIHFEYFSLLGKNNGPLFKPAAEVAVTKEPMIKYNFEEKIHNTLETVERYFKLINQFYNKRFKSDMNYNEVQFKSSDFCFKFFKDEDIARRTGMFYTLRVLTAHISYLKIFRCWLLEDSNQDENTRKEINSRLIYYFEEYLKLVKNDPDPQSEVFYEIFRNDINKMKKYNGHNLDNCK